MIPRKIIPPTLLKIFNSKLIRMPYKIAKGFYDDDCFTLAASISFHFLLSFIPFLILLGALMGYVVDYVQRVYSVSVEEMTTATIGYIRLVIPYLTDSHLERFFSISSYKAGLGTVGIVSLFISATLLFSSLHYTFHRIFGGKQINFLISRALGMLFIILISMLLFFIHYLFTLILSIFNILSKTLPHLDIVLSFARENGFITSFLITFLFSILFFHLLLFFFTREVKTAPMSIVTGAALFSFLWSSAKYIFSFYISELSSMNLIYGSMTWGITIILWIYYSSIILLLSLEFIKTLNSDEVTTIKMIPDKTSAPKS